MPYVTRTAAKVLEAEIVATPVSLTPDNSSGFIANDLSPNLFVACWADIAAPEPKEPLSYSSTRLVGGLSGTWVANIYVGGAPDFQSGAISSADGETVLGAISASDNEVWFMRGVSGAAPVTVKHIFAQPAGSVADYSAVSPSILGDDYCNLIIRADTGGTWNFYIIEMNEMGANIFGAFSVTDTEGLEIEDIGSPVTIMNDGTSYYYWLNNSNTGGPWTKPHLIIFTPVVGEPSTFDLYEIEFDDTRINAMDNWTQVGQTPDYIYYQGYNNGNNDYAYIRLARDGLSYEVWNYTGDVFLDGFYQEGDLWISTGTIFVDPDWVGTLFSIAFASTSNYVPPPEFYKLPCYTVCQPVYAEKKGTK